MHNDHLHKYLAWTTNPQTSLAAYLQCGLRIASFAIATAWLNLLILQNPYAAPLPKIISASLCADQYLLTFADPKQILALSAMASDTSLSPLAHQASRYASFNGSLETLMQSQADIVVMSTFTSKARRDAITGLGKKVVTLDGSKTWSNGREEAIALGIAIGREDAARSWVEQTESQLKDRKQPKHVYQIASYDRGGVASGKGHILNDLIEHAGHTNPMAQRISESAPISLETLISLRPDFVILPSKNIGSPKPDALRYSGDRGQEALAHTAFKRIFPEEKRIYIPQNLLFCAGPSFLRALEIIDDDILRKTITK